MLAWLKKMTDAVIVKIVAGLALAAILGALGYLKWGTIRGIAKRTLDWLGSTHTATYPGWGIILWLVLPLIASVLLACSYIRASRRGTHRGKKAVIPLLAEWVLAQERDLLEGRTVKFKEVDSILNLKGGASRKYLPVVIKNSGTLTLAHKSRTVATIVARC